MRRTSIHRTLIAVIAVAAVVVAAGLLAFGSYRWQSLDVGPSPVRVRVERGASLPAIAAALRAAGLEVPAWHLSLAARLRGDQRAIKAGVYEFAAPLTLQALLDKMVRGDVVFAELVVVEGSTFRQLRAAIARHPDLLHDSAALGERELLERIGASQARAEGLFFPSTYRFAPGSSDFEVWRPAYRLMQQALEDAWPRRQAELPLTSPYQALVLASIVEKETGASADRARVAAVFVNRLRRGMLLQSDPTTIYGLGESFDGNLRKRDLVADSPYNTYVRPGLPPTPISLPGRASIDAVLNPAPVDSLYFVARGDGSSEFSSDLESHNRAVARYQLKGRK